MDCMNNTRRDFLKGTAWMGLVAAAAGCTSFDSDEVIALKPFPNLSEPRAVIRRRS